MKITIDNLDGRGPVDYSGALWPGAPLSVNRTLNSPSRCVGTFILPAGLAVPIRRGRLVVSNEAGMVLFTGYLATEPVAVYGGMGTEGAVYRYIVDAVSDEWLLDRLTVPASGSGFGVAGGLVLRGLTQGVGGEVISTTGVADGRSIGVFQPVPTSSWSINAGALAGAAYGAYSVLGGALAFAPVGSVTHALSDGDGVLAPSGLSAGAVKDLANDVTVSGEVEPRAYVGEVEPRAYVAELFAGDGTTSVFVLSDAPLEVSSAASKLVADNFEESAFDPAVWQVSDPGSHLGFGAGGLTMTGGNGFDGQTTLVAVQEIEMGGTLLLEAGAVVLATASDGILCGLYSGIVVQSNCFVGYNVRQSGGLTLVTPLLNGVEVGTSYTALDGHRYTLRIRLHCAEMQRVKQTYYARVEGVVESFGGGYVPAPMSVCFELIDLGASSNTPATVLYDTAVAGVVASSPVRCVFCAVDAVQIFGSMGYCRVTETGSVWVTSTLSSGVAFTRLIGVAGEGVDCEVQNANGTAKVTFYAGRIPVAGEMVTVNYRRGSRAIARLEDPASVAVEAVGGANGTARWLGRVVTPVARSSDDCESAALAVLSFSTARSAALSGSYTAMVCSGLGVEPFANSDVWPGDVLALTANGAEMQVIVRQVTIEDAHAAPEALRYKIGFANDWAEGMGIKLSEAIANDVTLPQTAATGPAQVLANLVQMAVVSATGSTLQIDSGAVAPAGGGFEVRRRDGGFGPGPGPDLVLRSPVRSFSIPRVSSGEQYFVRMYDASTPPLYSRWSSAVFCNLPVD